jgi:hypothetical protein
MREHALLFPPSMQQDQFLAQAVYHIFDFISYNSPEDIKAFELRHLSTPAKNIKLKKLELTKDVSRTTETTGEDDSPINKLPHRKTVHTSLPPDSGRITKLSIAFLYGAIICSVLRDISHTLPLPTDVCTTFTRAIYTNFSLLDRTDLRHDVAGWRNLFDILIDIEYHGYHASAAMHSKPTIYCKSCSNINKNNFVKMQESKVDGQELKCPLCQGTETLGRRFTTRHLKNIYPKILKKLKDQLSYSQNYDWVRNMYQYFANEHKEDIIKSFEGYEKLAKKDLLSKKDCLFIVHYDPSKKWKKTSCYISTEKVSHIKLDDDRYSSRYEPLIKDFLNTHNKCSEANRYELLNNASKLLQEMGWPQSYIEDKIDADVTMAVLSSIPIDVVVRGVNHDP